jgi:hypothetical protein
MYIYLVSVCACVLVRGRGTFMLCLLWKWNTINGCGLVEKDKSSFCSLHDLHATWILSCALWSVYCEHHGIPVCVTCKLKKKCSVCLKAQNTSVLDIQWDKSCPLGKQSFGMQKCNFSIKMKNKINSGIFYLLSQYGTKLQITMILLFSFHAVNIDLVFIPEE